ncbi:sigma factor-like helix-turn-helix DNA-binding protein [Micromonospora sp. HUAS LYJ1]|uniref:sigma factor-like helix-turn-helix DNA-binding protein n=1 Tax=Micromonospora sp. HUAS LYJ1 TaxID=3061626 RepID=UPI0026738C36|nr:sigma factor-like helix-turn-helix DNA-binding protein [Micromonospora sp. HUAS LYJ1]WKU04330.1 sigma factor-like helix-turn-helix DNA-binding protein [Micromonospora sp. HUAS LYJ1]
MRQILGRTFLDERRRGWWRRERVGGEQTDRPTPPDSPENRLVLLQALDAVPPRQRAVLVLRYWEDKSVDEAAAVLGCSTGTETTLMVNGQPRRLDLPALVSELRDAIHPDEQVWAAMTQGDPTDFNIGLDADNQPIWFDYDTAGLNAPRT